MKVIIVGSGMYVTGRHNAGTGTILSSLAQTSKELKIEEVKVVSKSESSKKDVIEAARRINNTLRTNLKVTFEALGEDSESKLRAILKEEKFDASIISVPDHLHYQNAKILLEAGVHCLVVKPLTPTLKEARELIEIQKKYHVYGAVEFHKRFDETNLSIKKALSNNQIGKILYFDIDYSQRITIPTEVFKDWSGSTNIFQYLGVHYVDLIYFLTQFMPKKVSAFGTNGILKEKGYNTYDSVHVSILWEHPFDSNNKFISTFNTNWIDPSITSALSDQKYKVIGTTGRIECDQKNRGLEYVTERDGIQQVNPYFSDYLPDENNDLKFCGYGHKSIERFIHDVKEIKNNKISGVSLEGKRPTFTESLISTAVIDVVNQSLEQNFSWLDIKL